MFFTGKKSEVVEEDIETHPSNEFKQKIGKEERLSKEQKEMEQI